MAGLRAWSAMLFTTLGIPAGTHAAITLDDDPYLPDDAREFSLAARVRWSPGDTDLYLVYVADAVEVGRHLVGPLYRFSVVAVVAVAIDKSNAQAHFTLGKIYRKQKKWIDAEKAFQSAIEAMVDAPNGKC